MSLIKDQFQVFLLMLLCISNTTAQINKVRGSTVVFTCQFKDSEGYGMSWMYRSYSSSSLIKYSSNTAIPNIPARSRISITGDFSAGEYKLNIRDLQETDRGYYRCRLGSGQGDGAEQQLVVIVGPTSVGIIRKTPDNKIIGTEGKTLQIQCNATGGSPPPDVKLLIAGEEVNRAKQYVNYTTQHLERLHDGQNVTCLAGYISLDDFSFVDSAKLYLSLKPLVPNFNLVTVSVIEDHSLEIECTSTGSRPAAVFNWDISGANITNNSVPISRTLNQSTETFVVVSRLRFTFAKNHNGKQLKCKAINIAAPNGVPAVPITVDVQYRPIVTVDNKTFTDDTSPTVLTCNATGNPDTYSSYHWTHESLQGTTIRSLNDTRDGTITLPNVNKTLRYQNTGRYTCTVGNGIPDATTKGSGYGVLTINAPPVFSLRNSWKQGGEIRKTSNITVYVYSVPTPLNFVWYQGRKAISGNRYKTTFSQVTVTVMFHGKEIKVNGVMLTLTIAEVKESDFVTYQLIVSNSRGNIKTNIVFESSSAPDPPKNLTVIDQTDHSITVQWKAGYNGGHEQTFYILYKQQGSGIWTTLTGPKGVRGATNLLHETEIDGLQHSTKYDIKMFAENKINKSVETSVKTGVTKTKLDGGPSGAVIGGVVGGLLVALIVLVVVVVILKQRKKSDGNGKKKIPRSDSDSDGEDGLKDNILYKSDDTGSSKSPEAAPSEYAEVQKPSDVYAEVSKPKQQKGTKEKKQRGKKSPGNKKQKSIAVNNNSADASANQSEYGNVGNPTGGYKNADGLQYADLTFINPPKTKPGKPGKPVIHGFDDRTVYCDVDHTKKAPPLPQEGAYELTDISKGKQA